MVEYSIVISAFNEQAVISSSLTQVINFMNSYSASYEILVIDDGSLDGTAKVVDEYSKSYPQVNLIRNPHKGKAFGVRTGVKNSGGKYILFCDADMATPIEELKRLMVWIKDNDFDVVIASREGIGAKRSHEPLIRHIMGRVFNLIIKVLLLPGIQDTQCGFKVFKSEVAKRAFDKMILFGDNLPTVKRPRVTAFDVELLVILKRMKYKVKEVPISWTFAPTTRVNPVIDSIDLFFNVLSVKVYDILGKYSKKEAL